MNHMATESREPKTPKTPEPLGSAGFSANRRPLSRVIAQAASDAECSCAMAEEAADTCGYGLTRLDLWFAWWQGFVAAVCGDSVYRTRWSRVYSALAGKSFRNLVR